MYLFKRLGHHVLQFEELRHLKSIWFFPPAWDSCMVSVFPSRVLGHLRPEVSMNARGERFWCLRYPKNSENNQYFPYFHDFQSKSLVLLFSVKMGAVGDHVQWRLSSQVDPHLSGGRYVSIIGCGQAICIDDRISQTFAPFSSKTSIAMGLNEPFEGSPKISVAM